MPSEKMRIMSTIGRQMMHGFHRSPYRAAVLVAAAAMCVSGIKAQTSVSPFSDRREIDDPISKIARLINPKLAKVEDRVRWLDGELFSLARYHQYPLQYSLGYRGHRPTPDSPDPSITLDLGDSFPIESLYLVPVQKLHLDDLGTFPKRFRLEGANQPDFSDAELIHDTGKEQFTPIRGAPVAFYPSIRARYIRLTVQSGQNRGATDLFALSELFVFSNKEPVSFQATVTTVGDLDIDKIWNAQALVDGRTPLGIWHHGTSISQDYGDAVIVSGESHSTTWESTLAQESPLDRILLFPYQVQQSADISVFPRVMRIELIREDREEPSKVIEWSNPLPGTNHMTPLVFPLHGARATTIRVCATQPWIMGHRSIHGLSEIEIWSDGRNLAAGLEVIRHHQGQEIRIHSLTNGCSSQKRIAPLHIWLDQLTQRGAIEEELAILRGVYTQLASRSELNVSWGSAVVLGLTFLIPVFIFERKRMQSKEHLDIIRKRIASDLHDDIGSNLGSISLIARTARKDLARLNAPAEIDEDLGEVEMIARESSLAMRDIVWLLERKQDSIGDLVHRMRETAGRLLREIDFTLECSSTRTAAKLTLDAKRHLFLFYKEAIHNVVKHSKASTVSIRLWDEGEQLGIEVIDNGVGLPVDRDRVSIGVKKLQDRADVMGGILQITSSAETGTCIRMLVKRAYLTSQPKST